MDINNFIKTSGTFLKSQEVKDNPAAVFVITSEAKLVDNEFKGKVTQRLHVEGEFNQQSRIFDMSKTNSRFVGEKLGSDTVKWIGKKLVLETYKTKTSDGKLVDAINIKAVN